MRTPEFWKNKNLISRALYPLGVVYGLATSIRIKLIKPQKISIPVICIGNLSAGGTGKTPVSISIAELLQKNKKKPGFISRGYGGKLKDIKVNSEHSAEDVGDEPKLLSRQAPVFISPNRFKAASLAQSGGADIIIMDDGFQNPNLFKDLSFIVVDGDYGFGNGFCIPSGPLREDIKAGFKRADALIILGEDKHNIASQTKLPTFKGSVVPVANHTPASVFCFAGIGRPEKFYNSLKELGFKIIESFDFPDHHYYTDSELLEIINKAKSTNSAIFTTSKDFVKIPTNLQKHFSVLEISIKWEDEKSLLRFISSKI